MALGQAMRNNSSHDGALPTSFFLVGSRLTQESATHFQSHLDICLVADATIATMGLVMGLEQSTDTR